MKRVGPSRWSKYLPLFLDEIVDDGVATVPFLVFCWGVVVVAEGFVKSFARLMT